MSVFARTVVASGALDIQTEKVGSRGAGIDPDATGERCEFGSATAARHRGGGRFGLVDFVKLTLFVLPVLYRLFSRAGEK